MSTASHPRRQRDVQELRRNHPTRVLVKFRDDVRLPPGDLRDWLSKQRPTAFETLDTWLADLPFDPVFGPAGNPRIHELVERARETDPDYRPPRFENWYAITIPAGENAKNVAGNLVQLLNEWHAVIETAYIAPPPNDPPFDPTINEHYDEQEYLWPAPESIDAAYAWDFPGGRGQGQSLVDLEQGWLLKHEDLGNRTIIEISGENYASWDHGAAVLGIIAANPDNTEGCVGIAPEAGSIRVVSSWRTSTNYNVTLAVESALYEMAFGDVLLIEADADVTVGGTLYPNAPVEYELLAYQAIRLATALGVVVVEAAGNRDHDLNGLMDASGKAVFDRTKPGEFLDSGAIIVAAASSAEPHTKISTSNHGNRIDCYAWGENVKTLSSDGTEGTIDLYDDFGETSAAAAIIAGVALVVQGLAENGPGYRFGPRHLRTILSNPATGTRPVAADECRLGVMPNLREIIVSGTLNLAPDVYCRDFVGDDGAPHAGSLARSPDIIVLSGAVADPQTTYGEGSGTENDDTLGVTVNKGKDHVIYVRARNRGGSDANAVKAAVYWAEPSTLLVPGDWRLIGTATFSKVPTGNDLTVSDALTWPDANIPASGHYCFVAVLDHEKDPAPGAPDKMTWDDYYAFIRANNNVTWRNFNVVEDSSFYSASAAEPYGPLGFVFSGSPEKDLGVGLDIISRLPRGSHIELEVPRFLARAMHLAPVHGMKDPDRVRVSVHGWGRTRLDEIPLDAKARHRLTLYLWPPPDVPRRPYEIEVRQRLGTREVGTVTWRLEPPGWRKRKRP